MYVRTYIYGFPPKYHGFVYIKHIFVVLIVNCFFNIDFFNTFYCKPLRDCEIGSSITTVRDKLSSEDFLST